MNIADPHTEALLEENTRLQAQSKQLLEQYEQLMAHSLKQRLRESGIEDADAFYAWLQKQVAPMQWAEAERQADEVWTQWVTSTPALDRPATRSGGRRAQRMV